MPFHVFDKLREPLHVVVPVFNPFRYKTRWKHTERALKHFHDSGATITLVEAGFNRRELAFADSGLDGTPANCGLNGGEFRHKYIGLHAKDELWIKEGLLEIGVQNLPYNWQQVALLDSDVVFVRPNWIGETIHKLQHYSWLQMFSQARDLSPTYELMPPGYPHSAGNGFMAAYHSGELERLHPWSTNVYSPYHAGVFPGLAWACTRKAWDDVGGLIDFAVWGGADWHMAHALIEQPQYMMRTDLHDNYKNLVNQWADRCRKHIRRNVGYMDGVVFHNWHGIKEARGYNAKHELLAQIGFDPLKHIKKDSQGLYQLHDDGSDAFIKLRDMLRKIATSRNEDSNDARIDLHDQGH